MCSKKYHATNDLVNSISCGNMSFQTEYDELNNVRSYTDSIRNDLAENDEKITRTSLLSRWFKAYAEADITPHFEWVHKNASFILDREYPIEMINIYVDAWVDMLKLKSEC